MIEARMVKQYGITPEQFWSMVEPEGYPCDCRLWLGDWDENGYGIFHWSHYGAIENTKIQTSKAYRIARNHALFRGLKTTMHVGHLCGLAPCCNPLHLLPITPAQNSKDAWTHRHMHESVPLANRRKLQQSGMDFKEIARTYDIPPGVAFRILYGALERSRYPAPFVDDFDLPRQPKPWYLRMLEEQKLKEARMQKLAAQEERFWDFWA